MKKIACCGYHATGSGVIDDLLREMDNVACSEYCAELRILHDPDCISDLEYHIVTDPHRLGTGLALKRFFLYCKNHSRMEEKILGDKWMKLVSNYVDSLIINKYKGWTDSDLQYISSWKKAIVFFERAFFYILRKPPICRLVPKSFLRPRWYNYFPNYVTSYSKLSEDVFIKKTKSFIEEICSIINKENKEYVLLDQFICAHNPMRDLRYVDDMKVIIVDRDPRDLYVHHRRLKDHVLPIDPTQFSVQYRLMRERVSSEDHQKVLRLHYEDMVFKYDEMVPKVLDFLGIDKSHHVAPQKHFNPGVSINGTQLWIYRDTRYAKEVEIIQNELSDMLYNFPGEVERKRILSSVDVKQAVREYETKH